MATLGMMVGAWSMLVSIMAPTPVDALEGAQALKSDHMSDSTQIAIETQEGAFSAPTARQYQATVSAYSCDAHPANPMHPCGPFRDGSRPSSALHGLVAAGPYEWLGEVIHIEGYGSVTLVDTPRTAWYGDRPHIDLFLPYGAAIQWGIQERIITR
jgi:hypothetical protein